LAGFTFVGRDAWITSFRELIARPRGELLLVAGAEGTGKSHLLRRLRREAEAQGRHVVQFSDLSFLPDADLRLYSIISALAVGSQAAREGEAHPPTELLPNSREFLESLMTEDRRPPREKLLRVFSVASGHLGPDSRLLLLLDLGRAEGADVFPVEFLARRLPDKIKLVVATRQAPATEGLENVSTISGLPALSEGDVGRLLEFHLPKPAVSAALVSAAHRKFGGRPMLTDIAAKLAAGGNPAEAIASLPADPAALCQELLRRLDPNQRRLADCLARVPSGVDIASLRALTDFSDADLRRLLRSDEVRNVLITQRTARGPQASLFHDLLTDQLLAEAPDGSPDARAFHQRAAAFFLGVVQDDPHHVAALSAHAHHLRLSGDKRQFIEDFPKTYKAKHTFRLFHHLADEYTRLIRYCDELGESAISRPACLANLGRVHQELGANDDALRAHREALTLYQQADDLAGTAEQLASIAAILQAMGQLDEALDHLQRAAQLDEGAQNQAALAADFNALGILCQQMNRLDEATGHHQRALALHEELKNEVGVANQLANLAAIHRKRGDLAAARDCYQKAWMIDTRTLATLAQIADLCNLGLVFQELGDMVKAVTCFQQAIELDRSTAEREAEAAHTRTLASMYQKLGQHDEATRLLQQAIELDRSLGHTAGEAAGLLALGNAYRAAGDLASARDFLQRAVLFCSKTGDPEAQAAAQRTLELVQRQLRGETVEDEEPEPQAPSPAGPIQREPASEEVWSNLQIVDDVGAGEIAFAPDEPAPAHGPKTDDSASTLLELNSEVNDTLRRERDQALRRVAELEAELKAYKQIVGNLQKVLGQAARPP
jgi:tetratricopeptide (TPR) repeat protein